MQRAHRVRRLFSGRFALREPSPRSLDRALHDPLVYVSARNAAGGTPGAPLALAAHFAPEKSLARLVGCKTPLRTRKLFARWRQDDAIDRARRNAQPAAGAIPRNDGVHQPGRADYCVDRARCKAQRAADARQFVDYRHRRRLGGAVTGIHRVSGDAEQRGEFAHAVFPARRTLVNICATRRDGFGIGTASRVTALPALRLRQQRIDSVDPLCRAASQAIAPVVCMRQRCNPASPEHSVMRAPRAPAHTAA